MANEKKINYAKFWAILMKNNKFYSESGSPHRLYFMVWISRKTAQNFLKNEASYGDHTTMFKQLKGARVVELSIGVKNE